MDSYMLRIINIMYNNRVFGETLLGYLENKI